MLQLVVGQNSKIITNMATKNQRNASIGKAIHLGSLASGSKTPKGKPKTSLMVAFGSEASALFLRRKYNT